MVERNEMADLESKTLQSELKFLKSQINPHFYLIRSIVYTPTPWKKTDDAPDIVLKLSEMMRYMLYDCNEKKCFGQRDQVHPKLPWPRIHKAWWKDRHSLWNRWSGRSTENCTLIMMPFIENAFKHGTTSQINEAFVYFKLNVDRTKLFLNLRNSKAASIPKPIIIQSGALDLTMSKEDWTYCIRINISFTLTKVLKNIKVSLQIDL